MMFVSNASKWRAMRNKVTVYISMMLLAGLLGCENLDTFDSPEQALPPTLPRDDCGEILAQDMYWSIRWLHSGKEVLVQSYGAIKAIDVGSKNIRTIVSGSSQTILIDISSDDQRLYFLGSSGSYSPSTLFVVPITGGTPQAIADLGWNVRISSDEKTMVYDISGYSNQTGLYETFAYAYDPQARTSKGIGKGRVLALSLDGATVVLEIYNVNSGIINYRLVSTSGSFNRELNLGLNAGEVVWAIRWSSTGLHVFTEELYGSGSIIRMRDPMAGTAVKLIQGEAYVGGNSCATSTDASHLAWWKTGALPSTGDYYGNSIFSMSLHVLDITASKDSVVAIAYSRSYPSTGLISLSDNGNAVAFFTKSNLYARRLD